MPLSRLRLTLTCGFGVIAMGFWERTWQERGDEIRRFFGETEPPGMVVSYSWRDRIRLPGACAGYPTPRPLKSLATLCGIGGTSGYTLRLFTRTANRRGTGQVNAGKMPVPQARLLSIIGAL